MENNALVVQGEKASRMVKEDTAAVGKERRKWETEKRKRAFTDASNARDYLDSNNKTKLRVEGYAFGHS